MVSTFISVFLQDEGLHLLYVYTGSVRLGELCDNMDKTPNIRNDLMKCSSRLLQVPSHGFQICTSLTGGQYLGG